MTEGEPDAPADAAAADGTAAHPRGLYVLGATEFFARFAWFGMLALLGLYLILELLPGQAADVPGLAGLRSLLQGDSQIGDEAFAMTLIGWFTTLILFMPILGGLLADLWLGTRRTAMFGALLLGAGFVAIQVEAAFLVALGLFVLGMACFKGGVVAQVGQLYPREAESLRAQAYLIVSGIINVGAAAGTYACAQIAVAYGWQAGFGAAGGAMLAALIVYLAGRRHLPGGPPEHDDDWQPSDPGGPRRAGLLLLVGAVLLLPVAASALVLEVGLQWIVDHVDLAGTGQMMALVIGTTDAIVAIVAVPVLVLLWRWQARRGREPGDLAKLAIGSAIAGASILVLAAASLLAGADGRVSVLWPLACFLGIGIATLYCRPVLLALVSRAAPLRLNATFVGLAVLPFWAGDRLARWAGGSYPDMSPALFWAVAAAMALAGGLFFLVFRVPLARALEPESSS